MSSLPPLDVSLSSRKISCVLDGELALSRQGLLFAVRLAHEANVWLFRALWQALDNSYAYRVQLGSTPMRQYSALGLSPCLLTLQQWESARLETDLAGLQLFFVGDARHESLLPKDVGKDLVERFEGLAAELDGLHRWEGGDEAVYDPVYECHRDTAALATALIRHRPIVFSLCAQSGESDGAVTEPAICGFLRRCGIDCRGVGADGEVAAVRRYLQPIFARSGVTELLWDLAKYGGHLAVLHIIAPHAVVMPIETELYRRYGDEVTATIPSEEQTAAWFHDATAYWWKFG
jgi:hypothetical protein